MIPLHIPDLLTLKTTSTLTLNFSFSIYTHTFSDLISIITKYRQLPNYVPRQISFSSSRCKYFLVHDFFPSRRDLLQTPTWASYRCLKLYMFNTEHLPFPLTPATPTAFPGKVRAAPCFKCSGQNPWSHPDGCFSHVPCATHQLILPTSLKI